MLHTKFRGNWPAGSGEVDFLIRLSLYHCGGDKCQMKDLFFLNHAKYLCHLLKLKNSDQLRIYAGRSVALFKTT